MKVVAGVLALSLSLAACGSQSGESRAKETAFTAPGSALAVHDKSGTPAEDEFAALGAPTIGEKRVPGIGADIVPTPGKKTVVTLADALAKGTKNDFSKQFTHGHGAPTAVLATYTNVLGDQRTDGAVAPSVPSQTAWVLTWSDLPLTAVSRPAEADGSPPASVPPGVTCELVLAISATTGETLDSFRNCAGK